MLKFYRFHRCKITVKLISVVVVTTIGEITTMIRIDKLETRVLLEIAENPDINKYNIAKNLGYEKTGQVNKQVNNLLENKELIKVTSTYPSRGRELNRYGVTYRGCHIALLKGANTSSIRDYAKTQFKDLELENILLACDVADHPNLGLETLEYFNLAGDNVMIGPILGVLREDKKGKDFLELLKKHSIINKKVAELLDYAKHLFNNI